MEKVGCSCCKVVSRNSPRNVEAHHENPQDVGIVANIRTQQSTSKM